MKLNTLLIGIFVISIFSIGTLGYYTIKSHHDSDIEFFISLSPSDSGDILEFEQNEESEILKSFFIILSTSLVLSIMVGYVINRSVGKPIKKLSNTIDEVSRGNLEVKIDEKILENKGEIGDLARSLKRILVSLKIAILRKGPAKKLKLETEGGISENDLANLGLISNNDEKASKKPELKVKLKSAEKPKKVVKEKPKENLKVKSIEKQIKSTSDNESKVEKERSKKPLVTFPNKEE